MRLFRLVFEFSPASSPSPTANDQPASALLITALASHHFKRTFLIMSTSVGDVAGAPVKAVKVKMTKNQMKRAKKKENRARERASRDSSVVTESESESSEVSALLLHQAFIFRGLTYHFRRYQCKNQNGVPLTWSQSLNWRWMKMIHFTLTSRASSIDFCPANQYAPCLF